MTWWNLYDVNAPGLNQVYNKRTDLLSLEPFFVRSFVVRVSSHVFGSGAVASSDTFTRPLLLVKTVLSSIGSICSSSNVSFPTLSVLTTTNRLLGSGSVGQPHVNERIVFV